MKIVQANKLTDEYNLVNINVGDLIKDEIENNTPLGLSVKDILEKGQLIPNATIIGLIRNGIEAYPPSTVFLFDGFSRTAVEAQALNTLLAETSRGENLIIEIVIEDVKIQSGNSADGDNEANKEHSSRDTSKTFYGNEYDILNYYADRYIIHKTSGIGTSNEVFERIYMIIETSQR